jgi:hypothetical protein
MRLTTTPHPLAEDSLELLVHGGLGPLGVSRVGPLYVPHAAIGPTFSRYGHSAACDEPSVTIMVWTHTARRGFPALVKCDNQNTLER